MKTEEIHGKRVLSDVAGREKSNDASLEGERDSIAKWLKIEQIKS
jgi:hypothetical protein